MKRNSTTIYIETETGDPAKPCITPLSWLNNAPDFSSATEPSLSVLKSAYERGKNNIVVIPDPVFAVPLPRSIDMRRLRKALSKLGKLTDVNTAIASIGGDAAIDWEYATEIKEDYPLVLQLAVALNLDISKIYDDALKLT